MKRSETKVVCLPSSPSTPQHTTPIFLAFFKTVVRTNQCWNRGFKKDPLRKNPGITAKNLAEELAANAIKLNNDHFCNEPILEVFFSVC